MDTQDKQEQTQEEIEVVDTITEEKQDVVIEVTGFSLFADVKL